MAHQSRYQIRRSKTLEADIELLKKRWGTTLTSEVVRRAARLAVAINSDEVEDVYIVVDGRRRRLPSS